MPFGHTIRTTKSGSNANAYSVDSTPVPDTLGILSYEPGNVNHLIVMSYQWLESAVDPCADTSGRLIEKEKNTLTRYG